MPFKFSFFQVFRPVGEISLELRLFNVASFVLSVFSLGLLIFEAFGILDWRFILAFACQVVGFKIFAFATRSEKSLSRVLPWFCAFSLAAVLLGWVWGHLRHYEMNFFYALLLIVNLLLARTSKSHWSLIAFLTAFLVFNLVWTGESPYANLQQAWTNGILLILFSLGAWAGIYFVKSNYEQQKLRADRHNRRLHQTTTRLKTRNKHLEGLSQMISHNLRSPIMGLKLILKMYPKVPREEQEEIIDEFDKGLGDLHQMVEDLADILLDYRALNHPTQVVSLQPVFEKVCHQLRGIINNKQALINADFSQVSKVRYPEVYLNSIFHNLISNALKYHKPGQKPQLDIASKKEGDKVVLSFKDQGMGIDLKEHGHQLFKMYSSLGNPNNEPSRGIGLFMTKNQVEMLGGQIWVESEAGQGATFFVALESL